MKRILFLIVASCMFALLFAVAAQAATAQPTTAQDPDLLAVQDPAPRCVDATVFQGTFRDRVLVRNFCEFPVRVKVIVAFGLDSACTVLGRGEQFTHFYNRFGRFDGLERC